MDERGVGAEKRWEEWAVVEGTPKSSGGQGAVTKVQHLSDGRLGALKRLHPRYVRDAERRLRMAREEVEALSRVRGAGIPAIFAHKMRYAKDPSVPLWFISEWIEGETLQHRVRDRPQRLEDALHITRELTELIARCHAAGVIHRDIKPDNVIVGRDSEDS